MRMLAPSSFSDYLANPEVTEILIKNLTDFCLPATEKDKNHGVGSISRIFNNLKLTYPKHAALAAIYENLLIEGEGQGTDNGNWVALLIATGHNDLFDVEGKLKPEIKSLLNQKLAPNQQKGVIDSLYSVYGEQAINTNILSSYILNAYETLFNKETLRKDLDTVTFLCQQSNGIVNSMKAVDKDGINAANDVLVAIAPKVNNHSLKLAIYEFNNERLKELDKTRAAQPAPDPSQPVIHPPVVSRNSELESRLNQEIEKNIAAQKIISANKLELAANKVAYDKLKHDVNGINHQLQDELNNVKQARDRALYQTVNANLNVVKAELAMLEQEVMDELRKEQSVDLKSVSTIAASIVKDPNSQYHSELSSVTKKALRQYYSIQKLKEALKTGSDPIAQARSLIQEYSSLVNGKSHQSILEMGRNHPLVTAMKVLLTIVSLGVAYAAGIFATSGERLAPKMQFFNSVNIDKEEDAIKDILKGPSGS